jgi:hypothetical protein
MDTGEKVDQFLILKKKQNKTAIPNNLKLCINV